MNLAVTPNGSLSIKDFKMSAFFYNDSLVFKKLTIEEKTLHFVEFFIASVMLCILSPIFLLVALSIKCFMGGDVFYSQTRVGKEGKHFSIIKFRSMIENAEKETGPILAKTNDPRITRLGKFLRKSHLDELPQLINVINGEMSFVGPRPERPEFVDVYDESITDYTRRKEVRPGITGLAQICLPYDATASEKLEYDLFYIDQKRSIIFALLISYYTALKMISFYKTN